jgi:carboxymethylenebutenolidase
MSTNELNWMQRYAASEFVEHASDGRITRRQLLARLVGVCGSVAAASAFLAACDDNGDSSSSTSSTSGPRGETTGATSVTPATRAVGEGAALSVADDDPDVQARDITFPGPAGDVLGYSAQPTAPGSRAGVIVIHEIFGLNDHIRDVARRVAKAGYLALAPDLASRAGGTDQAENVPGALTQGPVEERVADLDAAVAYLEDQPDYNGNLGVVGFCFGGGMTLSFAAAQPKVRAAVPYYGPTPQPPSVMRETQAAILAHYGETDERVNAGIADLEEAMAGKTFERTIHPGVGHAFNNDTGPAYDEQAAIDAWSETLQWFAQHLARGNGG